MARTSEAEIQVTPGPVRQPIRKGVPAFLAFTVLLILTGSLYWIESWVLHPGRTLDQAVLFRDQGDSEYLPVLPAVARGNFGEASVWETAGRGVRSFPFGSVLLHAGLLRLLGDAGFIVADVLAFLFYGWVLCYFLTSAGITRRASEVLTLLVLCGALNYGLGKLRILDVGIIPLAFWHARFPRDLVTEPFFVALFCLVSGLIKNKEAVSKIWQWVLVGLLWACLLQGDVYEAMTMMLLLALLGGYLLHRNWRTASRGLAIAGLVAAVMCVPFIYQRLNESPDILRRLGMFPVGHRLLLVGPPRLFVFAALVLTALAALRYAVSEEVWRNARSAVFTCAAAVAASVLTGPLFLLALGRGIELYHHVQVAENCIGYAVLLGAGVMVQELFSLYGNRTVHERRWRHRVVNFAFVTAAGACLAFAAGLHYSTVKSERPTTPGPLEVAPEEIYKSSFAALHTELMRPKYSRAEVLATLDVQLAEWWQYRNKYLYLPDINQTIAPDREVEARVYSFMRLMSVAPGDFNQFLNNRYFRLEILALYKYQGNVRYTPWPLQEYSPEDRTQIALTPITDSWLAIPGSERKRLLESYEDFNPLGEPYRRLDLIVLSKGNLRSLLHPEKGPFEPAWSNDAFEIWVPDAGAKRQGP